MIKRLEMLVREFEQKTGVRFDGEIKINGRLSKCLGRCVALTTINRRTEEISCRPIKIELSKNFLRVATYEEIVSVLAHEYGHWCAYAIEGEHNHDSEIFKKYCNILRTSSSPVIKIQNKVKSKYSTYCSCCGKSTGEYTTKRAEVVSHPEWFKSKCCKEKIKVVQNF